MSSDKRPKNFLKLVPPLPTQRESGQVFFEQIEMNIDRPQSPDRNHARGGRSFYFFDFDDNVVYLPTPLFLFHKKTGGEMQISTQKFAEISSQVGTPGPWRDFEVKLDPKTGSFRRFRHQNFNWLQRAMGRKQPLTEDMASVLSRPTFDWRGPSWDFFWHAVHNGRPLSIITARGHRPETIREAISLLVKEGHLSREPNYLSIFPVSNLDVRAQLGDSAGSWSTARLKKEAIKCSVEVALKNYGKNPAHRFGMSDDDPENVKLIVEAMRELKQIHPSNSFFVIDTQGGKLFKQEVRLNSIESPQPLESEQLSLF